MDFQYLLELAAKNQKTAEKELTVTKRYSSKVPPPKKEPRPRVDPSAIRARIEKKEQDKKKKAIEEEQKKQELLKKRAEEQTKPKKGKSATESASTNSREKSQSQTLRNGHAKDSKPEYDDEVHEATHKSFMHKVEKVAEKGRKKETKQETIMKPPRSSYSKKPAPIPKKPMSYKELLKFAAQQKNGVMPDDGSHKMERARMEEEEEEERVLRRGMHEKDKDCTRHDRTTQDKIRCRLKDDDNRKAKPGTNRKDMNYEDDDRLARRCDSAQLRTKEKINANNFNGKYNKAVKASENKDIKGSGHVKGDRLAREDDKQLESRRKEVSRDKSQPRINEKLVKGSSDRNVPGRVGTKPQSRSSDRPNDRPNGRPSGRPSDRSVGRPSDRPSDRSVGRPIDSPRDRSSDRPIGRPSDRPCERPVGRPSARPSDRPVGRPSDRPNDRPVVRPSDRQLSRPSDRPRPGLNEKPKARPADRPESRPNDRIQGRSMDRSQERGSSRQMQRSEVVDRGRPKSSGTAPPNNGKNLMKTSAPRPPQMKLKRGRLMSSDSEESVYDDLDGFIDDTPFEEDNCADVSSYIKQIFGYDKKKYGYESDYALRSMDASFRDVQREEARSTRLGMLEDLEDIRKEKEELKRKAMKKQKR